MTLILSYRSLEVGSIYEHNFVDSPQLLITLFFKLKINLFHCGEDKACHNTPKPFLSLSLAKILAPKSFFYELWGSIYNNDEENDCENDEEISQVIFTILISLLKWFTIIKNEILE